MGAAFRLDDPLLVTPAPLKTMAESDPVWLTAQGRFREPLPPLPGTSRRIALVIDDLGLERSRSRATIALPAPMTLAFLPYGHHSSPLTQEAAAAGHEVIVHLPMEPHGPELPGPNALRHDLPEAEFLRRLDWSFEQFDGFVGFNNHMGSLLTENRMLMDRVMVRARQVTGGDGRLYFLDSLTSGRSVAARSARAAGLEALSRDVFLDHEISTAFVERQLTQTEHVVARKGYAIAIGHPHRVTIAALETWIPEMQAKGYEFVTLSDLLDPTPEDQRLAAAGAPDGAATLQR